MSFSHFGELWLTGSHGGGITSGMYAATYWMQAAAPGEARWGFGIGCCGLVGQSELGAATLFKAVWWDLRLASLLTHLFCLFATARRLLQVCQSGLFNDNFITNVLPSLQVKAV